MTSEHERSAFEVWVRIYPDEGRRADWIGRKPPAGGYVRLDIDLEWPAATGGLAIHGAAGLSCPRR